MIDIVAKLSQSQNFNEIFEIVKTVVQFTLKKHRAGLTLILKELPNEIGAYHVIGSNYIVMNVTILDAVFILVSKKENYNAFIFYILLHEYIHSLGYYDEKEVKNLVYYVTERNLGKAHFATDIASRGIMSIFPELIYFENLMRREPKVIKEFDTSSMPYIS